MKSRVLVTGAAGLVGRHVVAAASRSGVPVSGLGRRAGIGVDYVMDLTDREALGRVPLDDIVAVIHCAGAIPSRSQLFERNNIDAAQSLIDALAVTGGRMRVVHVSTVSVYALPSAGIAVLDEGAPVVEPDDILADPYASSKRRVERLLDDAHEFIEAIHVRASSIYGRGMALSTLLPVVVDNARCGAPIVLTGPQAYVQNFVHAGDVADLALSSALTAQPIRNPPVINAFSDDTYGLTDLALLVVDRLGSQSMVVDQTDQTPIPHPQFVNRRAHLLKPHFRALRDHLDDVA